MQKSVPSSIFRFWVFSHTRSGVSNRNLPPIVEYVEGRGGYKHAKFDLVEALATPRAPRMLLTRRIFGNGTSSTTRRSARLRNKVASR